jgi:murein L,D-transpeptidase YcbB/YkuD
MSKHLPISCLFLVLWMIIVTGCGTDTQNHPSAAAIRLQTTKQIEEFLTSSKEKELTTLTTFYLLRNFYAPRQFQPVWTDSAGLNAIGQQLYSIIQQAPAYGFPPGTFPQSQLTDGNHLINHSLKEKANHLAQTELRLTNSAFLLMTYLKMGKQIADTLSYTYPTHKFLLQLPEMLNRGIDSEDINISITASEPSFPEYKNLVHSLHKIASQTGFIVDSLLTNNDDTPLMMNRRLPQIFAFMGYSGRYGSGNDSSLTVAVKAFQHFCKIPDTGTINDTTLVLMRQHFKKRYYLICLNLERLRQQQTLTEKLLWINVPAFHLKVYENDTLKATYRVIVGKPETPTPKLTSRITNIQVYPNWNVPHSITGKELLEKAKRDSTYLKRKGFRILDFNNNELNYNYINWSTTTKDNYRFRLQQKPSLDNSLGIIKFNFPNPYSVYLHDTNAMWLFNTTNRALSHGCVRLNKPLVFARYLLQDDEPNLKNLDKFVRSRSSRNIVLKKPVSLTMTYLTCEADSNLNIRWYNDLYDLDEFELHQFLNSRLPNNF